MSSMYTSKAKLLGLLLVASSFALTGCKGKEYSRRETSNSQFKVRAIAYHEITLYPMPGAFYVYESAPTNSEAWKEFLTIQVDDPNPILFDNFHFVNEHVAYINSYQNVVVTTDAGKTWHSSNTRVYGGVTAVNIYGDGSGSLKVKGCPLSNAPCVTTNLVTSDFGMTWRKE